MISVILIWIYMAATCFLTGYAALKIITLKNGYQIKHRKSYLYAGLVWVTVYAQIVSLFGKVGFVANLILLIFSALVVLYNRRELIKIFSELREKRVCSSCLMNLVLILIFAYGTSIGYQHYDTGLYHAQSIRWIEEYGMIRGLGNLHSRLAYNSSSFSLTALFSFKWLTGQSFHVCSGFLALLLAQTCMERFFARKGKEIFLSDLIRVLAGYYILNIFDEMISPASDYFMVLTVFYLLIRWLELIEEKEHSYVPYGLLCILAIFVITVKFSGALILLLVIAPAVCMIREKKWLEISRFILAGGIVVVPFLIRNVLLSGWLLYPFTAIDLFHLPYKIPKGMAEYDAREIQVFGRGYTDVAAFNRPFMNWFPNWVKMLSGTDKMFLLLAILGILLFLGILIDVILKKKKENIQELLVMAVLMICLLFWIFTAPLIRYGCIFLWVFPVLVWGFLYQKVSPHVDKFKGMYILLIFLAIYKMWNFGNEMKNCFTSNYFIVQKDYEEFESVSYKLHGEVFYYPKTGDRTGYQNFPGAPVKAEDIFLGDEIKDGFKDVIHQ